MIATRSNFPRFAYGRNRLGEWIPRNRPAITEEQRQARDSQFDCAGSLEDYFAQPRARSLLDQLADNRQEIERLRQELAVAKYRSREESQLAAVLVETIGKIVELSQRLFPGSVSFEYAYDPEDPSEEWLVFDVTAKGEYKDYRETVQQWHDEVEQIVPGTLCEFRLSVMPLR